MEVFPSDNTEYLLLSTLGGHATNIIATDYYLTTLLTYYLLPNSIDLLSIHFLIIVPGMKLPVRYRIVFASWGATFCAHGRVTLEFHHHCRPLPIRPDHDPLNESNPHQILTTAGLQIVHSLRVAPPGFPWMGVDFHRF